jgi:hypothetical protein
MSDLANVVNTTTEIVSTMAITIVFGIIPVYIYFFYFITKLKKRFRVMRKLHLAISSIYEKQLTIEESYAQIALNYEQLSRDIPTSVFMNILEVFDIIIYYYDSYTKQQFESEFSQEKNLAVRDFIFELRTYIKSISPFISVPDKEAGLLQTLKDAIVSNNPQLGDSILNQLSDEIAIKEKAIRKNERDKKMAITLSIIGIILTAFFGIISAMLFLIN